MVPDLSKKKKKPKVLTKNDMILEDRVESDMFVDDAQLFWRKVYQSGKDKSQNDLEKLSGQKRKTTALM